MQFELVQGATSAVPEDEGQRNNRKVEPSPSRSTVLRPEPSPEMNLTSWITLGSRATSLVQPTGQGEHPNKTVAKISQRQAPRKPRPVLLSTPTRPSVLSAPTSHAAFPPSPQRHPYDSCPGVAFSLFFHRIHPPFPSARGQAGVESRLRCAAGGTAHGPASIGS